MPLVMTSGNRSDEPIAYDDGDARARLSGIADVFLTNDRPIHLRCDDSVTRVVAGAESPIRRSRGDAPQPLRLPLACRRPTLAVGGQLKATFALGRGRHAFLSHHIGDLDHYEAYRAYTEAIGHYERLFAIRPELIVHDLHPDYASTSRYASERAEQGMGFSPFSTIAPMWRVAWPRTGLTSRSSGSRSTAPASGRTGRSGGASSSWAITGGSAGRLTCGTSRCRVANGRSASPGEWRRPTSRRRGRRVGPGGTDFAGSELRIVLVMLEKHLNSPSPRASVDSSTPSPRTDRRPRSRLLRGAGGNRIGVAGDDAAGGRCATPWGSTRPTAIRGRMRARRRHSADDPRDRG